MSKIICDICGTTYPDTADQCPICGCSRDAAVDLLGDDLLMDDIADESRGKGGRFSSKKKKQIFDYDEVNAELDEEEDEIEEEDNPYEDEEEEYEEAPRHNTFVVILLTVLIAGLLFAAGFLFLRYILPNMGDEETVPSTTIASIEETTEATTEPTIPCESLVLTSGGKVELNIGGQYLIHATATPENTTDKIVYTSLNESIATVTEDGKITAVALGETEIEIVCGMSKLKCTVVVQEVVETEPPTTEAVVETVPETTVTSVKSDVVLKLKKTDIRLGVYYEFQLELDCDLEQNEVEWRSEHPHIATVDENGVVKAVKDGTTSIIAKYGDQEVQCIVRCSY